MSKTGLPQKCGTCREEGHNKSTCPNKDIVPAVQATVPKKRDDHQRIKIKPTMIMERQLSPKGEEGHQRTKAFLEIK
ncbi:hypothetical protein COLO4_09730 [Corchorus olitorius]|uniref:Uncharacterized protein n=1 Tax=Corchorus olitorius TaxID=93759 RepID=A0A1R3KB78_9ROSI|nr:hypothetical protein COLO4_09730 [Corchorus olitorius]